MSPFVWMFISSHERMRTRLIDEETITSLIQLEYSGFEGATVPICTFTLQKGHVASQKGCFIRLSDFRGSDSQAPRTLEAIQDRDCGWFFEAAQDEFKKIPGSPVAYWVSERVRSAFDEGTLLGEFVDARVGLQTGNNNQFLRRWHEVDRGKCSYHSKSRDAAARSGNKWFPYNKGGEFRKWYGNQEYLVNWEHDGRAIRAFGTENGGRARSRAQNTEFYFQESLTWSDVTSGPPSFRLSDSGGIHDVSGMSAFSFRGVERMLLAGFCNTPIVLAIARATNPTLHFQIGNFVNIPFIEVVGNNLRFDVTKNVDRLVHTTADDWNAYERSWDFQSLPLLTASSEPTPNLESSYTAWTTQNRDTITEMKRLEEENNRLFIDAYGLTDELIPGVPIEQITLTVNPAYRSGGKFTEEDRWTYFRRDTMKELVSYAIGCMMGRYSLDAPGLIYAQAEVPALIPGATPRFLPTQTASCHSPTPIGLKTMPPIASLSSSRWPGMRLTLKTTSPSWPATSHQGTTSRAARLYAATSATASSRTICRPTRSAPSTGSSQAAGRRHFSASSICIGTTKAHWPGCVPST